MDQSGPTLGRDGDRDLSRQGAGLPRPLVEALRESRSAEPRGPEAAPASPREARAPSSTANDDHRAAEKILPMLQAERASRGPLLAVGVALAWLVIGTGVAWGLGIDELPVARAAVLALALLVVPPAALLALVNMAGRLDDIRRAQGSLAQVVIGLADRPRAPEINPQAIAGVARDVQLMNDALDQVAWRVKSFEQVLSAELIRAEQSLESQRGRLEEAVSGIDASMRLTSAAIEERLADVDARLVAGMGQNVGNLDAQVEETLRAIEGAMTRGSQAAIETIRAEVAAIEDGLRSELYRFAAEVDHLGGDLSTRVGSETHRLVDTLGQATDATASRLAECLTGLHGHAVDLQALVGATFDEAGIAVARTAEQAAAHVQDTLSGAKATLDESIAARVAELGTSCRAAVDAITDQVVVIESAVREEVSRITSVTADVGDEIAARIAREAEHNARMVVEAVEASADRLGHNLVLIERGAMELDRAGATLDEVSRRTVESLGGATAQVGTALSTAADELGTAITARVESVWQAYEATLDSALASLAETLDDNVGRKLLDREAGFTTQADTLVATMCGQMRAELEKAATELADEAASGVRTSLEAFVERLEAGLDGRMKDLEASLGGRMLEVADVLDGSTRQVEAALDRLGTAQDLDAATSGLAERVAASAKSLETSVADGVRALEAVLADDSLRAGVFGKVERAALDIARRGEEAASVLGGCLEQIERRLDARHLADELRTAVAQSCDDASRRFAETVRSVAERETEALVERARSATASGRQGARSPAERPRGDETLEATWLGTDGPGGLVAQPPEEFIQSIRQVIGEVIENDAMTELWAQGFVGRKVSFGPQLYTAKGRQLFEQVARIARADAAFRTAIESFVDRFETRVRDVARLDRSGALERAELMSSAGKTYTLLVHAARETSRPAPHETARAW